MTQERFLKLLDNPDLLASISYEELKTLALAYPYAHNLRYLLAIKSRQDNHPDFSRNLAAAAAHSLDRTRLFQLIAPKKLVPAPVEAEELVLELKPIETVQQELQARAPVPRASEKQSVSTAVAAPPPQEPEVVHKPSDIVLDLTGAFGAGTSAETQPAVQEKAVENKEKTTPHIDFRPSFAVWANQFNVPFLDAGKPEYPVGGKGPEPAKEAVSAHRAENEAGKHETDSPQEEPALTPQMLAEKSVTENKDILSETLARLYAQQGYREKAVAMYERLSLAFPDKSAYFAAEIEKLKK